MYEPSAKKADLLRQIEEFKALTQCSDKVAGKVFGMSESTIKRLRRDYGPKTSQKPDVSLPTPVQRTVELDPPLDEVDFVEDLDPI
jgi:hypothetical protein